MAASSSEEARDIRGLLYTTPAVLLYLPLVVIPLAYSFSLSFHRWNGLADQWAWVGLANFKQLLGDRVFWRALGNNVALVAVSLLIQLPIAMACAVVLARATRLMTFVRTNVFLPYVLPTVVIALVWKLLFNSALPGWLGSTTLSLPAVFVVICWRFIGFHMVLYLSGIASINPQLYEAARLDGASEWQCFRSITLPLLQPVLKVSIVLAVVGAMKYFDIVYVMTGGGPAHATELMATYMYKQAFQAFRFGTASALAVLLVGCAFLALALVRGTLHVVEKKS